MTFNKKEYDKQWRLNHREERIEYMKKWRAKNKEHVKEYSSKSYKGKKEFILSYNIKWLVGHGHYKDGIFYCPECGEEIDVTQVHNHHVEPSSKLFNISRCSNRSCDTIEKELVKTIPICPQCHKLITAKERNYHVFKEFNSMTNAELIVKFAEHVPSYKKRR